LAQLAVEQEILAFACVLHINRADVDRIEVQQAAASDTRALLHLDATDAPI
jgi:hypothetical protein